ncbi:MAG TPA: tetratricopeptide repeat protein [Longimicrobium sp.]
MNYDWFRRFIARTRHPKPAPTEDVPVVQTDAIPAFRRKFDSDVQKVRGPLKNPALFNARMSAAQVAVLHGDPEQAIALTGEMIADDPDRALPWTIKAQALLAMHRVSDAIGAMEQAIRIDPSDPGKWEMMAACLRLDSRDREAAECEHEAARLKR